MGIGAFCAIRRKLASFLLRPDEFIALAEALNRLAKINARQSHIVELRFFGVLIGEEAAEVMGLSVITIIQDWRVARARLFVELQTWREITESSGLHSHPALNSIVVAHCRRYGSRCSA
jgi:hypothetical protein